VAEEADAPSEEEEAADAGKGALRTGTVNLNSLTGSKSAIGHPNLMVLAGIPGRGTDKVDHLWTQVVHLDSTSLVAIDTVVPNSGSLFSDFLPPVNPRTSTDELTNQRASGRIREDLDAQKLRSADDARRVSEVVCPSLIVANPKREAIMIVTVTIGRLLSIGETRATSDFVAAWSVIGKA
jgi:hypothetical protein